MCYALEAAGNEVSPNKSICTASCVDTGLKMQHALSAFAIKFDRRVKRLGTGYAAAR